MKSLKIFALLFLIASCTFSPPKGTIKGAGLNSVSVPSDSWAFAVGDIYVYSADGLLVTPLTEKVEYNGNWNLIPTPPVIPGDYLVQLYGVASTYVSSQNRYKVWAVGDVGGSNWTQNLILEGNGSTWKPRYCPNLGLPTVLASPNNVLSSVSIGTDQDTWAVGYYNAFDQTNMPAAFHLTGNAWNSVSINAPVTFFGAINSLLKGVSVINRKNAWAVGYSSIYSFDSTTMMGKNYTSELIEHWDGYHWNLMNPAPDPQQNSRQLNGVFATNENDVWAVGSEIDSSSALNILIEHWNGSFWQIENFNHAGQLNSVYASSPNDVWSVGTGNTSATSMEGALVLHFNGSDWKTIQNPYSNKAVCTLNSISGNSPKNIWAVGNWDSYTISENWNGYGWKAHQTK